MQPSVHGWMRCSLLYAAWVINFLCVCALSTTPVLKRTLAVCLKDAKRSGMTSKITGAFCRGQLLAKQACMARRSDAGGTHAHGEQKLRELVAARHSKEL